MKDQEQWKDLCARAAGEQDPTKLMELTKEIIRLLDEKEIRLKNAARPAAAPPKSSPSPVS